MRSVINDAILAPLQAINKGPIVRGIGEPRRSHASRQVILIPFEAVKEPEKCYNEPKGTRSLCRRQAYALVFTAIRKKSADLNLSVISKMLPSLGGDDLDFIKEIHSSDWLIEAFQECNDYVQIPPLIFTANITGQEWDWLLWIIKMCSARAARQDRYTMPTQPVISQYIHQFSGKTQEDKSAYATSFLRDLIMRFQDILSKDVLRYCVGVKWVEACEVGIPDPVWNTYVGPGSEEEKRLLSMYYNLPKKELAKMAYQLSHKVSFLTQELQKSELRKYGY